MTTNDIVDQIISAAEHKQWLALFALVVIGLTALVRYLGPKLHDKFGALVTSDRGGQVTSIVVAEATALVAVGVSGQRLTWSLILGALVGGTGAGGLYNLVKNLFNPSDQKAAKKEPLPLPPPPKQAGFVSAGGLFMIMLLALACVAFFAFAGCAGWTVFKNCELGKLPAVAQTVIPSVVQDLSGSDSQSAIAQVEADGAALAPGLLECTVAAIEADVAAKASKPTSAELAPSYVNIMKNSKAFLVKHPVKTACGEPASLRAGQPPSVL